MATKFEIGHNSSVDYTDRFHCTDLEGKPVMHLYRVHMFDPKDGTFYPPAFVLADSKDGAISQATCRFFDTIVLCGTEQHNKIMAGSWAEEIPFQVRGWSKVLF